MIIFYHSGSHFEKPSLEPEVLPMFRKTLSDRWTAGLVHRESVLSPKWHNYLQLKSLIIRAFVYTSSFTSLSHFLLILLSLSEPP